MWRWLPILALVVSTPAWAAPRLAVVGLEGLGLDTAVVHPFERLLVETATELAGGSVLTPAEIAARITAPGLEHIRDCGGDEACLMDLGGILETPLVLYGTLTRLGDHYVISIRMVDVETGETNRGKQQLSGEQAHLIRELHALLVKLIDPTRFTGSLLVTTNVAGASAALDGKPMALHGEAVEVPVGRHTLTVEAQGYRVLSTLVEVHLDETQRVEVVLEPASLTIFGEGGLPWHWIAVGVGGGTLAASATLGGLTAYKEGQVEDNYRASAKGERYYDRQDRDGRTLALWTNITLGVGSALVGGGLLAWWLGDDEGSAP